jgi:hypothetical protein
MNRRRANQLRGKINQHARQKAYLHRAVTVEVNAHTSVNVHHSFYREWHWQSRNKPPPRSAVS